MAQDGIRKAHPADVLVIHDLLAQAAQTSSVIPRSKPVLYETLRDFFVYCQDGSVRACGALHVMWEDLAEVKSLAVEKDWQGRGMGQALAKACIEEARQMGIRRVFALTAAVDFFEKLGFSEIDKNDLPHKVWGDCVHCPKFPDCDEVAMQMELDV